MLPSHTCEHTHIHTNRKRKVHYTSISGSVLIVMGDRCKVLGSAAFTHTHTHTHKYRHNLFYTHTRKDINLHSVSFLCWFHTRTHFSPSWITHTHTCTHTSGQCSIHLTCLAVADNNDQKSPWEGLVRRWAVPFTKTTHYSSQCLDEWPRCACS